MKFLSRLCGLWLAVVAVSSGPGQVLPPSPGKITKIEIRHVGPSKVSDELIRANIRVKPGDDYLTPAFDDDIRSLYATGFFYNIQVTRRIENGGIVLVYVVQEKPRLIEIKFQGNKKYSDSKLRKKLTSKEGEPFNEAKLFTDTQEILKMYQKAGYPQTKVECPFHIDPDAGKATATFVITETPKVKIVNVEFVGAQAFSQKKLRKEVKTRRHWWMSWITGSGYLKDEVLEDDQEKLRTFYRDHGYIDFEIKKIEQVHPAPKELVVRFVVYEGVQYKVGSVKFTGNKLFTNAQIAEGLRRLHSAQRQRGKVGTNGLSMDVGDTFTPKGFTKDIEAVEDFYGAKGYIDVNTSSRNLNVLRVPNTEAGTMDLEFQIDEGQKTYVEKVEIRGNTKTRDKVIRRELSVSPGEVFDMVNVKLSRTRIEQLQYFEPGKVDARPEPTDPPITGRKNLVIGVEEKNTGTFSIGAAFSSVDEIVGFAEMTQGNFDLFHPPTFTGGGQKLRLRIALGTVRQDYTITFEEPWLFGQKLRLTTELYHHEANYQSLDEIYNETRTGAFMGIERALFEHQLGGDFLRASIGGTVEDVGIELNSGFHGALPIGVSRPTAGPGSTGGDRGSPGLLVPGILPANVPDAILAEVGHSLLYRQRFGLAFDTRNSVQLPNKGQRSEFSAEVTEGDREFYKLRFETAWYFKGFLPGHVLEMVGRTGVAESLDSNEVPFYDRFYLGGLYDLRGYKYRSVAPREARFPQETIGGNTYWFGTLEYSIPIFEQDKEKGIGVRLAFFYDIGDVRPGSYEYNFGQYTDNWGIGLRLNLPIGPLRLDYGVPIHHDEFQGNSGRFQFGVGYTRAF